MPSRCEDFLMPFGKHQGKRLGAILDEDPTYLDWLRGQELRDISLYAAVCEICEKYNDRIEQAVDERY